MVSTRCYSCVTITWKYNNCKIVVLGFIPLLVMQVEEGQVYSGTSHNGPSHERTTSL